MIPRPARNNNPGDLDGGDHWQGLMPVDRLTDQQKNERFAVFSAPEWGFRALVVLLRNYQTLYKANTVSKIIDHFAPPVENNTAAYKAFVAGECGVHIDDVIDQSQRPVMFKLAKAIAHDETGSWEPYWTDAELNKGLDLAGFAMGAIA